MTGLTRFALSNTRLVIAGTALVILSGILTYLDFPAQEDPPIKVRVAVVSAYFPGMSPGRVEELITKPLENKIREIPEVQRITSSSFTRSEEHTSELQSLMRNSYAVFCLKQKKNKHNGQQTTH